MSDSVGIVTSTQNPAPQISGSANTSASSSSTESFQVQTTQNQQNQNTTTAQPAVGVNDSNTPISPRIVVDPLAGPITEVLSANGQIQAQFPSAAVVAYLRAGLTSSGLPKPTVEQTPQQAENNKNNNSNGTDKSSVVA
jgi:hypothetical protein